MVKALRFNKFNARRLSNVLLPCAKEVWGKVIFSQQAVCLRGRGACVAGKACVAGGMHGRLVCMAGGHVWQGRHAWQGRAVHDRGLCMAGT